MTAINEKVEARVLAGTLRLPAWVQRRLAGKPVVLDGQTLATETQLVLRMEKVLREPAVESFPVLRGREVLLKQSRLVAGQQPIGATEELKVDGAEGKLAARLYVPRSLVDVATAPLLVFFHGGGFIYGDLESHDAVCRFLAELAGVRVLAVNYRLAPEAPFPAAPEDAAAAYRWVVANAASLGADPERLAVGGDSAGGALAATTAIVAAREGLPLAFQLLVYPLTDLIVPSESRRLFADGFFLTQAFIDRATDNYQADDKDPRASVQYAEIPDGLAPAYVVTAGFDPLRDEGEAYARKLAEAGVTVELKRFTGLIHGFLNWVGVGRTSKAAVAEIAATLRAGLR